MSGERRVFTCLVCFVELSASDAYYGRCMTTVRDLYRHFRHLLSDDEQAALEAIQDRDTLEWDIA